MLDLNQIYNTDALEGLKQLDENSIDAIISDPPYQLTSMTKQRTDPIAVNGNDGNGNPFCRPQAKSGFMNKSWDVLPSVEILKECLRVLKTGAWALWLMTPRQDSQLEFLLRLRQTGFNISYGSLEWLYLSGFPKAADLSLLADKRACRVDLIQKLGREPTKEEFKEAWGKWREVIGKRTDGRYAYSFQKENAPFVVMNKEKGIIANTESIGVETNPHTQEAQALSGSYAGMQLKPARELIIVSQKPIAGKTYLDQALLHLKEPEHNQLGGTWLDEARIPYKSHEDYEKATFGNNSGLIKKDKNDYGDFSMFPYEEKIKANPEGRFPANIIVSDNALDIGIKHYTHENKNPLFANKNSIFNLGGESQKTIQATSHATLTWTSGLRTSSRNCQRNSKRYSHYCMCQRQARVRGIRGLIISKNRKFLNWQEAKESEILAIHVNHYNRIFILLANQLNYFLI